MFLLSLLFLLLHGHGLLPLLLSVPLLFLLLRNVVPLIMLIFLTIAIMAWKTKNKIRTKESNRTEVTVYYYSYWISVQ
jgi:hypothetical protein